jgi:glutathione S-transferase
VRVGASECTPCGHAPMCGCVVSVGGWVGGWVGVWMGGWVGCGRSVAWMLMPAPCSENLRALCRANVGPVQALVASLVLPLGVSRIKAGLGVAKERAEKSLVHVQKIFDKVSSLVTTNPSGYCVGDGFTAADLTFSALAAPMLLVQPTEGYGAVFPTLSSLSPEVQELVQRMRATPAGQHALRCFRDHRGARVIPRPSGKL